MRRFVISYTHFGHDAVYTFKDSKGDLLRPWAKDATEGDQILVARWNSVVDPDDKVYVLGDVVFPRRVLPILNTLNGKKVLIKGNHDIFKIKDYLEYFEDVRGAFEMGNVLMTHIPIHPQELGRWKVNIHGHLHERVVNDPRYVNVSVEQVDGYPVNLEQITSKLG